MLSLDKSLCFLVAQFPDLCNLLVTLSRQSIVSA